MTEAKRYRAFISYSQKDKSAALRVHRALESYNVPAGVDAPGLTAKQRKLGRFFRDDDEMGAATDLGAALRGAIADSEGLIVICSRNSARSHWVNEEVLHFKRTGRADKIFAVVIDGRPDAATPDEGGCFPPALRFELGPDGALGTTPTEPLGIDLRKQSFARSRARLAAGLLGISFDALWRRDRRRATLRTIQASAAAALVLGIVGVGAVGLLRQSSLSFSAGLAAASENPSLNTDQAIRLAVLASRDSLTQRSAPEAHARLIDALGQSDPPWVARISLDAGAPVSVISASPDGSRVLTGAANGAITMWDAATGERLWRANMGSSVRHATFVADGAHVAAFDETGGGGLWDAATGRSVADIGTWGVTVNALSKSNDGRRLLTIGHSAVQVWDTVTGRRLAGGSFNSALTGAALSGDGAYFVVGVEQEQAAGVFNAATGQQVGAIRGLEERTYTFRFLARNTQIASVTAGDSVTTWDIASGREILPLHSSTTFNTDGSRIARAGRTGVVQILDAASGRELFALGGHGEFVTHTEFSADGARFLTIDESIDGGATARLWDTATGTEISTVSGPYFSEPLLSPDGSRLLWATNTQELSDGGLRQEWHVTELSSGATLNTLRHGRFTDYAIFAGGADAIVTNEQGGSHVRVWRQDDAPEVWTVGPADPIGSMAISGLNNDARMALSNDARLVVLASPGEQRNTARLFDVPTRRTIAELVGHTGMIQTATFSPDGAQVVTGGRDGFARIWDATGRSVATLDHEGDILSITYGPDATRFVTVTGNGLAYIWSNAERSIILRQTGAIRSAAFSADGARVLTVASKSAWNAPAREDGPARLWNAANGEVIAELSPGESGVRTALFNADGTRILTLGGGTRVWDGVTGAALAELPAYGEVAAFSPDGRFIAVSDSDGAIIFDARTFARIALLRARGGGNAYAFSPDGALLLMTDFIGDGLAYESVVRVWDVERRREITVLRGVGRNGASASFTTDGSRVLTVSDSGVRLWDARPLREVRARTHPNLSYLAERACLGRLSQGVGLITEDDARIAPILRPRIGQDVCAAPSPVERVPWPFQ